MKVGFIDSTLKLSGISSYSNYIVHRIHNDFWAAHTKWQFEYFVVSATMQCADEFPTCAFELAIECLVIISGNNDGTAFSPSVITSKPAIHDHFKTGHRDRRP